MSRRISLLFSVLVVLSVVAAACSDGETPFATVPPTSTPGPTSTPAPTSSAQPQDTPTPPAGSGDPVRGETLFTSNSCSACHSKGSDTLVGPGLAGIGQRADDAYIRQSIEDPSAVIVEGFIAAMPDFTSLTDADINDLVAFLNTLQ